MKKQSVLTRIASFVLTAALLLGILSTGGALTVSAADDHMAVNTDIIVTYTGNTYQAPGDVVMIRAGDISDVVDLKNIQLVRLEDTGRNSVGYIDRTAYDYDGVHDGEFTISPTNPVVDWSKAVKVEVIHVTTTDQSIQFIIPTVDADGNPMQHGIYAVKLPHKNGGKDVVVYLNAPVIDYVLGSDGSFASPGTLLEIVGENLSPCQNANADAVAAYKRYKDRDPEDLRAVLVSKEDPSITYDLEITDITSDYNFVVRIPESIEVADDGTTSKWEVYVYNGYGDSTAWSIPVDVEIGKAWADRIPDNFINVMEFGGLTGHYKENATPVIQSALNALNEMGGGTLYLPEGSYRLESTIYIPANVHVKGEGVGLTNILPVYLNYNYNNLPGAVFQLTGNNIEISDMAFYMKRSRITISSNNLETAQNIRLNNLKFYTNVAGWTNNGEGPGAPLIQRFEIFTYNENRRDETSAFIGGTFDNLRVTNINALANENELPMFNDYNSASDYGYFENIQGDGTGNGWNRAIFNYAVWKNVDLGGGTATQGHGVYQWNCKYGPCTHYNREITVADLDGMNGYYYEIHTEEGLEAEDSVYLEVYNSLGERFDVAGFTWWPGSNMQIYIQAGMDSPQYVDGLGQTRFVVDVDLEKNCIVINRPFADTSFTKNNFSNTRVPREDIYWVDCEFYEGSCGGSFYGGCADVVLDGSHREYNYNAYQYVKNGDCNWYMSIINECWENTMYSLISSLGMDAEPIAYSFKVQNRNHGQMAFLIRNNDLQNGAIEFDNYNWGMMTDFIIDNNRINEKEYVFYWEKNGVPDGMTVYRISGNKLEAWGAASVVNMSSNAYLTMLDQGLGQVKSTLLGDVNGDGVITLADVTYLEEALAGQLTLLPANQVNADVDGDNTLTAMDAIYLRYYMAGEIDCFPVESIGTDAPDVEDGDSDSGFTPGFH